MGSLSKQMMHLGLSEALGLSTTEALMIVDGFFTEIAQALVSGESVRLSGFGQFKLLDKAARPGRNPKTGEAYLISPRRVVSFKDGLSFTQRIQPDSQPEEKK